MQTLRNACVRCRAVVSASEFVAAHRLAIAIILWGITMATCVMAMVGQ